MNSPFQRFKRNLLLLLQILLLLFLVLAAMQPVLRRGASNAQMLPVLIDCSASMAALGQTGGPSRLDLAKAQVRELIDGLAPDQQLCLIAFSSTARRLTGFTNNKVELRGALDSLQVDDVAGNLDQPLRLAHALTRTVPFSKVRLYSDGNFPPRSNFDLSFNVEFIRLPPAGSNYGITQFNARRELGGQWNVFVQLAGSPSSESATGTVNLMDGEWTVASELVTLTKDSAPRLTFRVPAEGSMHLQARFIPQGFDSLESDNVAWLTLPSARSLQVYVPKGLTVFRQALKGVQEIEVFDTDADGGSARFDLVVTDNVEGASIPAVVHCTAGVVPKELESLISIQPGNSTFIDWRRDSPLLRHVILEDVVLSDGPIWAGEDAESKLRNLGYEILADGPRGPLILEKRNAEGLKIHLLFKPERSTLPYRVAFPVFVSNLIREGIAKSHLAEIQSVRTGILSLIEATPGGVYQVHSPYGERREETAGEDGRLGGIPALRIGEYVVSRAGEEPRKVGAALLSPLESSLVGVEEIEFQDDLKISAAAQTPANDRSLWWPIAAVAFGLLAVEWWWFNRRTYRPA